MNLTLSPEQAAYLRIILSNVGGDPKGPRGEVEAVRRALIENEGFYEEVEGVEVRGSIYFK